jgi:hypothetical protein
LTVLLLPLLAIGCGAKNDAPPVTTQPAATRGAAATEAPAETPAAWSATASSQASATTPTEQPLAPPAAPTSAAPRTPQPGPAATQLAAPAGKLTLPAKLGAVTFDHEQHAKRASDCTICHHPSRLQKPQVSENQACRDCHTQPAAPPMKTGLQAAFHDPKAGSGTCIDCHKKHVAPAKGGSAPVKCLECHQKK